MIFEEMECKKVFLYNKRWAKHWLINSAHRAHSSTLCMKEPADKTIKFIEILENKNKSYKEKIELLDRFYYEQDSNEKNSKYMGSGYYIKCLQFNERSIRNIIKGESIDIPKILRS